MSEINELRRGILLRSVALASSFIVAPMAALPLSRLESHYVSARRLPRQGEGNE